MEQTVSFNCVDNHQPSRARQPRRTLRLRFWVIGLVVGTCALVAWKVWPAARLESDVVAARQLLREASPESAADRLENVLRHFPDSDEAEFLLAVANRRRGRLDLVEVHLVRAAELGWDPKAVERERYLMLFQAGNFRAAGPYLKELLLEGGSNDLADEVYEVMVHGYMAALLFNEAQFILDNWLKWRPDNAAVYLLKARLAEVMNDQPGEVAAYRAILAFDPTNFIARRKLAKALMLQHHLDDALLLFLQCREERPDDAATLLGLAEWNQRRGRLSEARQIAESLLKMSMNRRDRSAALNLFGQIARTEKDYPAAIGALEEAVELDPADGAAVYGLSQLLLRAGRAEEAAPYLARWGEIQKLDQVLDDLHDAIIRRPDDADLRSRIGTALLEKGDTTAGVNWLLSALFHDRAHAATHERLAEHYERVGQDELAKRHREAAQPKLFRNEPPVPLVLAPGAD